MVEDIDALRARLAEDIAERASLVQAHEAALAEVRREAQERLLEMALRFGAERMGAHDPDAVLALMDRSEVSWSESGEPIGVEAALSRTREARRYLFRDEAANHGERHRLGQGAAPKPAPARRQDARALSEQDYLVRKRQFLAGQI
ncbi:phage scaffolding protein [Swaminathania salitolerans]|nr:phage scaffolding protein [Swaminathania salitolerans]